MEPHECGKSKCRVCHELVDPAEHLCYLQPKEAKDKNKEPSFIFFDLETTQEEVIGEDKNGEIFKHATNCCCVQKVCDKCYDTDILTPCPNCGNRRDLVFVGENALNQFCDWLFTPQNKDCYVIAHNYLGDDGQFIVQWIHEQGLKPEIITRGLQILTMRVSGITFLDSLNFLPMPLSSFPKTFGITEQKGYFPHLFNRQENWNYIGPLPDAHFYCSENMKQAARDEFDKWYKLIYIFYTYELFNT